MSYCTQADIVLEVGESLLLQLCSDGEGGIDTAIVANRIERGEAVINSNLGPEFTVPFTNTVASVVKHVCVDLAVFFCYERKPEFRTNDGKNPEQIRWDRSLQTLKAIREGKQDLGSEAAVATASVARGGVVYASTQRFILEENENTLGPSGGF